MANAKLKLSIASSYLSSQHLEKRRYQSVVNEDGVVQMERLQALLASSYVCSYDALCYDGHDSFLT